jgi:hypothetical protein
MAGGTAGQGPELGDLFPHLSVVIVDKSESTPSGVDQPVSEGDAAVTP